MKKCTTTVYSRISRVYATLRFLPITTMVFATNLYAQNVNFADIKWKDSYDQSQRIKGNKVYDEQTVKPILGDETEAAMRDAIARYQIIVNRGGWHKISNKKTIYLGDSGNEVRKLRYRLALTGDLIYRSDAKHNLFDKEARNAVKKFQKRHGLKVTGKADHRTLKEMNVPAKDRLQTLQINLERTQRMGKGLGNRYVVVNVPSAELEVVENGYVYSRHVTVVGKKDRQTPEVSSAIRELNFNPYWHAPVSIVRKDIIPKAKQNVNFLQQINLKIFNGYGGEEVDPKTINWDTLDPARYLFRQEPGKDNAMASVKINFPNKHSVYLHDTPSKSLFLKAMRYDSSGCVRVDNIHILTEWLLKPNGNWPKEKIQQLALSGERMDVQLDSPAQLRMVYLTSWAKSDGKVYFRRDIYNRDGLGIVYTENLNSAPQIEKSKEKRGYRAYRRVNDIR